MMMMMMMMMMMLMIISNDTINRLQSSTASVEHPSAERDEA